MSETSPPQQPSARPAPLVTVVIPVFNKKDTVIRSIESVRNQSLSNFECYIVDDGSTDDSAGVVKEIIKDDSRFHYIYQQNSGVAIARNTGVFSGDAPFVCCLDADDWIEEKFLEVCVAELQTDPSIGIAYTGLWYTKPDGSEGLSPWPGAFDYDAQLQGRNQIPTCNVARREVWDRLGGQRQRYAPDGAGEEDAEMWLRAGSIGFSAKKVTDAGLFRYSWLSGAVSGSTTHTMTDWRAWHPWTKDQQHPFGSVAKPVRRFSHPVRQYDEPTVSVIIPVGSKHKDEVINALDSLEAQSFRYWEVIIVDDTGNRPDYDWQGKIKNAYPFVRFINSEKWGAGAARNVGANIARAPLLLFLDADDWFHPHALEKMLSEWERAHNIVYSDYIGKVFVDEKDVRDAYGDRVLHYSKKAGEASIYYKSAEYDCEKAVNAATRLERSGFPYVWCLITALVPKAWHDEINGFDESMDSWEDWDYWIRMAKSGKCFTRIPEGLVAYRFSTGERREAGLQAAKDLLQYLQEKYTGVATMGCNCKNKQRTPPAPPLTQAFSQPQQSQPQRKVIDMTDSSMVLVEYMSLNRGDHRVTGPSTNLNYGYRQGGTQFLVHQDDVKAAPHLFKPVNLQPQPSVEVAPASPPPPPKPISGEVKEVEQPEPIEIPIEVEVVEEVVERKEDDLQTIPGMSATWAQTLNAAGVHSFEGLIEFGAENLKKIKGIGDAKANLFIDFAEKKVAGEL